jgi:hypothetical protein
MQEKSILLFIVGIMFFSGIDALAVVKNGMLQVSKGSKVYACVCDETCGCGTIGTGKGKCQCGHELEKVTLSKIENNIAYFTFNGAEHRIPLKGTYGCACESGGNCCDIISQRQVLCGCGKEMKAIK